MYATPDRMENRLCLRMFPPSRKGRATTAGAVRACVGKRADITPLPGNQNRQASWGQPVPTGARETDRAAQISRASEFPQMVHMKVLIS